MSENNMTAEEKIKSLYKDANISNKDVRSLTDKEKFRQIQKCSGLLNKIIDLEIPTCLKEKHIKELNDEIFYFCWPYGIPAP